jgi:formylglycine-generating enzyme required for sulfatase activity
MIVTVSGRLAEDGSMRLDDPSFGAPNLVKMYPGRSGLPTAVPASPEVTRLLQELTNQNITDKRRLDIGVQLAKMGDPRPGVGVQNGVPEVDWVFVSPGGSVDIKGTRKAVTPFYLARYPVTYAQYEEFVKASDGFDNAAWWRDMPSNYRPPERKLSSQENRLSSAPRTNVSWYQAVAFTRWLTSRMKASNAAVSSGGARVNNVAWEVRLPTEWEWQWAAQGGSSKREYPWGSWQDGRANAGKVLNSTTAVGMYPQGATMHGVLDMSGNVWEWCLNKSDSPYSTTVYTTNEYRVLRGGSFGSYREYADSSFRYVNHPLLDCANYGFRVGLFSPL